MCFLRPGLRPRCRSNPSAFVNLDELIDEIGMLFDVVDEDAEQSHLLSIVALRENDQEPRMEIDPTVKTPKVTGVVGDDREVRFEGKFDDAPVGRTRSPDPRHVIGFDPSSTGNVDEIGG